MSHIDSPSQCEQCGTVGKPDPAADYRREEHGDEIWVWMVCPHCKAKWIAKTPIGGND